jgi:HSP20 family protein
MSFSFPPSHLNPMAMHDPGTGLLLEALELLQEADRMHRQFFTVTLGRATPCWVPPVDVVESGPIVLIRVALPGVDAGSIEVMSDGPSLRITGHRRFGAGAGDTVHRLEIPYGRFERRIDLPPGRYEVLAREILDGCLVLKLARIE